MSLVNVELKPGDKIAYNKPGSLSQILTVLFVDHNNYIHCTMQEQVVIPNNVRSNYDTLDIPHTNTGETK